MLTVNGFVPVFLVDELSVCTSRSAAGLGLPDSSQGVLCLHTLAMFDIVYIVAGLTIVVLSWLTIDSPNSSHFMEALNTAAPAAFVFTLM